MANDTKYGYLISPAPQFLDTNGKPISGGRLKVYIAGTTTKATTYSDWNLTKNTWPIILDAMGTCQAIVSSAELYKFVLESAEGEEPLVTRDNVAVAYANVDITGTGSEVVNSDGSVEVTATTDQDTGRTTYDVSVKDTVQDLEGLIEDETDRATAAEKAAKTVIVEGDNITVTKTEDRRCRNDFNTQISVPIAQRMMELLRTHRPSKLYTYNDIFSDVKPADYLLSYFEHHFGFRFEELSWRFDPEEISEIVKSTMEPLMKQLALVLYSQKCDIIVLAGRPTSLDAITELFIKYVPTAPDRLIRLNEYRVGNWFPTADGQGYFYDQKAVVAVGGMVGYLASHSGLKGLVMDFTKMIKKMNSTANYMGEYNSRRQQVTNTLLSPTTTSATLNVSVFPAFIGCRQFDSVIYQARPLYAIYNHGPASTLQIRLSRAFNEDKEQLIIEEATDSEYRNRKNDLELVQQSLVDDCKYWLDKGEFELTIK